MIIKLNQVEYAHKMCISVPAVSYRLAAKVVLPGVVKIERIKNWYILHYDTETDIREARESFKRDKKIKAA